MYGLSVITPPAEEPVSLDRAKLHLRVDHDEEDDLIGAWIVAARGLSESHTGRRWISQELRLTLSDWPCEWVAGLYGVIRLPVQPVLSVDAVKYYSVAGVNTTLVANTDYQTWLDHAPPLVAPAPATVWPTVQTERLAAVTVEFTAGYGADANDVPDEAKAAVLLCLGYWYEHRGDGADPANLPASLGMPAGAKRLLDSVACWS